MSVEEFGEIELEQARQAQVGTRLSYCSCRIGTYLCLSETVPTVDAGVYALWSTLVG